jgi:hypothetical protein
MSKRKDSCYRYGRSPHWLKMKNAHAPALKREAPRRTGEDDPPRGLAQADRLIADCMDHIARQREVITTRYQQGPPTDVAESMLWALKESLRAFEKHRQYIAPQQGRQHAVCRGSAHVTPCPRLETRQ